MFSQEQNNVHYSIDSQEKNNGMTKNVIHKLSLGIVTTTDYGYISIDRKASFEQKIIDQS